MTQHEHPVRQATASDAAVVAELLDAFNREFDTPTPGTEKLTARLRHLLAGDGLVALLTGEPVNGVAILSFRPSVWYEGPAALLDELYVRPDVRGQRFGHAMLEAACRFRVEIALDQVDPRLDDRVALRRGLDALRDDPAAELAT